MSVPRETSRTLTVPAVSRETGDRLDLFEILLRRWNPRINLVSKADLPHLRARHINDSLQLLPLLKPALPLLPPSLPPVTRGLDLGSGAGFPGLILAIAANLPFDLVEADQRKASFLREAARETAAPVTVHACRIEACTLTSGLITARALAPLAQLLPLVQPLLQPTTQCLFLKGANADIELAEAAPDWTFDLTRHASATRQDGVILQLRGIIRVGGQRFAP